MGIFTRRRHDDTVYNGTTTGHHHQREKYSVDSGYFNRRPSFGQWLKVTWLDILTMVLMGALGLGIYKVPIWLAALLASIIPIVIILFMQIRIRSFWDVNNAIIGLLYSLITAAVFQVFLKWLIGGLRPHFLDVCKPNLPEGGVQHGNGFAQIMYDRRICTGDINQIDDSLESFPSGHSTAAWAVFANYHPAMWKIIAIYAPVLGATLISGALTIDEFHNWYDVVAGAIIGATMATSAYRMVYASIWDFRFNHIPLTRHTAFSYGAAAPGAGGFETAVWTRQGGWGDEEALGGAPGDAGHGLRGGGMEMQSGGFGGGHAHGRHHDRAESGGAGGIARRPVPGAGPGVDGRKSGEHMV
ncbi:MAG: hypothetical protein Q9227_000461 [Pyrenula ochraceoflavens]